MLVEAPAHELSAKIFALAETPVAGTRHIGEVTAAPAFRCFP
jgi:hypothetical protein